MFLVGLLPFDAFAQQADVAASARSVSKQIVSIPRFIAVLSYVIGTAFAVRALFALKGFITAPDDNPINVFIGLLTVSTLLILLPYTVGVTQNTLALQSSQSISSTQSSFYTASCTGTGLNAVFCNMVVEISPYAKLLAMISYVLAAMMLLSGLLELKAYGDDPSRTPIKGILMKFIVATMFVSLPLAMNMFITSVTGVKSSSYADSVSRPKFYNGSIRKQQ